MIALKIVTLMIWTLLVVWLLRKVWKDGDR